MDVRGKALWLRTDGCETGAVITRLNSTIRRTKKYLDGSIPCLEELEETRLPYFEKNADKRENRWSQIISGSDLIDTI